MTTDTIVVAALIIFGCTAFGQLSAKLISPPWDLYVGLGIALAWVAVVLKGWDWWQNRR